MSSLSCLGSVSIIMSHIKLPLAERKRKLRRLLLWLSVVDFATGAAYLLSAFGLSVNSDGVIVSDFGCKFQAVISSFSPMSSVVTTALIGLLLYEAVCLETTNQRTIYSGLLSEYPKTIFIVAALIIPAVLCFIVAENGRYGYSDEFGEPWCWINTNITTTNERSQADRNSNFLWRMVGGKGVELIGFVVIVSTYVPTMLKLKKYKTTNEENAVARMAFLPGAYLILRLPSFLRVLVDSVNQIVTDFTCVGFLSLLQSLGDPSQGFINGVVYGIGSKKSRASLLSCCIHDKNHGLEKREDSKMHDSYGLLEG